MGWPKQKHQNILQFYTALNSMIKTYNITSKRLAENAFLDPF